jgi:predicted glycosyltransferase
VASTIAVHKAVTVDKAGSSGRIWIDLDNSPHVPFFAPIIRELELRGYSVMLTARDSAQVCDLLPLFGLKAKVVGGHYGKHKIFKIFGTLLRAFRLLNFAMSAKPNLAMSHGSRAQLIASKLLGMRTLIMDDYEHSNLSITPDWLLIPEVIKGSDARISDDRILTYPGIKEDAYVPGFKRDPDIRKNLGISESEILVTIRPPANEAHYHNPESDVLYDRTMQFLFSHPEVRVILVPRSQKQAEYARESWPEAFASRKVIIPEKALDGLSLIWWSDVVVSGGGTMNREAAALGVPVYSIFRGPLGAVDRYLASTGRLIMLPTAEDISAKLTLQPRIKNDSDQSNRHTLSAIVDNVVGVMNKMVAAHG